MQVPQQAWPVGAHTGHPPLLGVGLGVIGEGLSLPGQSGFHQHLFPPLRHALFSFSVAQSPPATEPSMQIVDGKGSFFEQMYFA